MGDLLVVSGLGDTVALILWAYWILKSPLTVILLLMPSKKKKRKSRVFSAGHPQASDNGLPLSAHPRETG
jgi:hypothetical protein